MSTRHARRLVAAVSALVFATAFGPGIVLGHAELDMASPADKATVTASPAEIVFTFTEPVVPAKSSLKLVDDTGKIVAEGSTVDPTDAKTMRLTLGPQSPGTYTVRWTTASALDGDLDHGTTTFTIAATTASPTVAASASASASVAASEAPSPSAVSVSPSPSADTGPPTSAGDAVIPVLAALVILGAFGLWLLRGRSRRVS
jgi:methionine-rich copper-binding protein CopC